MEITLSTEGKAFEENSLWQPRQNLYDVVRIFIQQLKKDDISERAGAMAFSYTIALFPLMLFLLNMIPYLQDFFRW